MDKTKLILQRVSECLNLARKHYGIDLPWIDVLFDLAGDTAGQFCMGDGRNWFRFNRGLVEDNLENFLAEIVPHEVSHYVTRAIWGRQVKSHGSEWKSVMLSVYSLKPSRCHSMDTRVLKVSYQYKCNCADLVHKLSKRQHNKALRFQRTYCRLCKAFLIFIRELAPDKNPLPIVDRLFVSSGGRALTPDDFSRVKMILSTCTVKSVVADSDMTSRDCQVLAKQLGIPRDLVVQHERPNSLPGNVSHAVLFERLGSDRHARMAKAYAERGVVVRVLKTASQAG